jgi:hypothetical protein
MPACKKSVKFIRLKLFKWELNFFYLRLLTKYFIMKKVLFIAGFVSSVAIASTPKEVTTEMVAEERLCTVLETSCGPSGDVCGANAYELARNAAWAENYWCGN